MTVALQAGLLEGPGHTIFRTPYETFRTIPSR